jgi:hypothetical protein
LNASSPNAWAKASTYSIGDGIVGLSEAMEMTRRFLQLRLVLLEEELQIARHQTGKNSGVIHSGVYYKPGSLKAHMCVSVRFQEQHITRLQVPSPAATASIPIGRGIVDLAQQSFGLSMQ